MYKKIEIFCWFLCKLCFLHENWCPNYGTLWKLSNLAIDYNVLNQPETNIISGHHIYSKPAPLKCATNIKTFNFFSFHKFISKLKLKLCNILSHNRVLLYTSKIRIRFSCIHIQCTCMLLIPMTNLNEYQFLFRSKTKEIDNLVERYKREVCFYIYFVLLKLPAV